MVSHAQESPGVGKATANKALHLTAIPLRYIASGELGRWAYNELFSQCTYDEK